VSARDRAIARANARIEARADRPPEPLPSINLHARNDALEPWPAVPVDEGRADRPPEPPTPEYGGALYNARMKDEPLWRPPEPPTLDRPGVTKDRQRQLRERAEEAKELGYSFVEVYPATLLAILDALGDSPPPPDLGHTHDPESVNCLSPHGLNPSLRCPRCGGGYFRCEDPWHKQALGASPPPPDLSEREPGNPSLLTIEQRIQLARDMGRMAAERDAVQVVGKIVLAAGGEVRVPDNLMVQDVTVATDYIGGATVYRALASQPPSTPREPSRG